MNIRKIIVSIIGILILVFVVILTQRKSTKSDKGSVNEKDKAVSVLVKKISLNTVAEKNLLTARVIPKVKQNIALTVGGRILYHGGRLKVGESFHKGELIVAIDPIEVTARLKSQKSQFVKLLSTVVPDLSVDYPDIYDTWQRYLLDFDIEGALSPLPKTLTKQQRLFLYGRGIYENYYSLKEILANLEKYKLYAPFEGVITEATVDEGTVVAPNATLGEFISTGIYELETAVELTLIPYLKIGNTYLFSPEGNKQQVEAKLIRINEKVDEKTQSIRVFLETRDKSLKVGMYLSTHVDGSSDENLVSIPESALVDEEHVFVVINDKTSLKKVVVKFREHGNAIVEGLQDNDILLLEKKSISFEETPVNISEQL